MPLRLDPLPWPRRPDVPALREAGDVGGLVGLLSHRDPEVQWQASQAIAALGRGATGHLLGEMDHPDPEVRLGIIEALGDIGDPAAVSPLARILGEEGRSEVRWAAALALGSLGEASAIPPLVQALRDPDKYVRFGAALSLGRLGWEPPGGEDRALLLIARQEWDSLPAMGAEATRPLLRATRDRDPSIRARAVDLLGALGDARAADACVPVLRDTDSEVRWRATLALPRCGIPLMRLPLGLARRPRAGKSPAVAAFLNFVLPGQGYLYLEKWWGVLIFQVDITATLWLFASLGDQFTYELLLPLYALISVHAWYLARKLPEM